MKKIHLDDDLKSSHITRANGNVFADLVFSPMQEKAMLVAADAELAGRLVTKNILSIKYPSNDCRASLTSYLYDSK